MYNYGKGVERNYSKAKEFYEKGANLNNSDAMCNLGLMYQHGQGV